MVKRFLTSGEPYPGARLLNATATAIENANDLMTATTNATRGLPAGDRDRDNNRDKY